MNVSYSTTLDCLNLLKVYLNRKMLFIIHYDKITHAFNILKPTVNRLL
jgi:hypothetical protein